ncbi:MAG: PAAR domain-containing protein [Desulfobacteraceae bacterium]
MPGAARLGDKARAVDAHGCKACAHTVIGPAVQGSSNVTTNGKPAVRKGDGGIHSSCCGPNRWRAGAGSKTVFINGKPAFRQNDLTIHCGGIGKQIQSSGNVIIGDSQSTGFKNAAKNHAPFVCNCNK